MLPTAVLSQSSGRQMTVHDSAGAYRKSTVRSCEWPDAARRPQMENRREQNNGPLLFSIECRSGRVRVFPLSSLKRFDDNLFQHNDVYIAERLNIEASFAGFVLAQPGKFIFHMVQSAH